MKIPLPLSAVKIVFDETDGVKHSGNIKLVPSDPLNAWIDEHNVTDYSFEMKSDYTDYLIVFQNDAEGLMFKLAWSDK